MDENIIQTKDLSCTDSKGVEHQRLFRVREKTKKLIQGSSQDFEDVEHHKKDPRKSWIMPSKQNPVTNPPQ